MFFGELSFHDSILTPNIAFLTLFMTVVLSIAQDDSLPIPALDVFQCFFCWKSMFEAGIITGSLWMLRHIERLIGTKMLFKFFVVNMLTFLPFFAALILALGFKIHFSFFYFLPFSLFLFSIWKIPSLAIAGHLTDKLVVICLLILLVYLQFPYSIAPLISSIIGYCIWNRVFIHRHDLDISSNPTTSTDSQISLDDIQGPLLG